MEKIKPYLLIIGTLAFYIIASLILFHYWPKFDLNIYSGISTFLVGLFAIFLYIKQKEDYRRDAANIILMEIRNAEKIIDQIKSGEFETAYRIERLLPTNNWNKYNYLFIKDFDRDELDYLNDFYNQCTIIDNSLSQINTSKQLEQKNNHIQRILCKIAEEANSEEDYETRKNNFTQIIEKEGYTFRPATPIKILNSSLGMLNKITVSNIGKKLKKIAKVNN